MSNGKHMIQQWQTDGQIIMNASFIFGSISLPYSKPHSKNAIVGSPPQLLFTGGQNLPKNNKKYSPPAGPTNPPLVAKGCSKDGSVEPPRIIKNTYPTGQKKEQNNAGCE